MTISHFSTLRSPYLPPRYASISVSISHFSTLRSPYLPPRYASISVSISHFSSICLPPRNASISVSLSHFSGTCLPPRYASVSVSISPLSSIYLSRSVYSTHGSQAGGHLDHLHQPMCGWRGVVLSLSVDLEGPHRHIHTCVHPWQLDIFKVLTSIDSAAQLRSECRHA